jgi:hypothetical protein
MGTPIVRSEQAVCVVRIPKVAAAKVDTINATRFPQRVVEGLKVDRLFSIGKPTEPSFGSVSRDVDNALTDTPPPAPEVLQPISDLIHAIEWLGKDSNRIGTVLGQPFDKRKDRQAVGRAI